ncbi:MAG: ChbG/HpnK family deacetylase [Bacteroidetes bacterium]|nr:MAG: ChbG/HpnK family deacetylase [Bacteroidota bacterium]
MRSEVLLPPAPGVWAALFILLPMLLSAVVRAQPTPTLAERLGYGPEARLLIVNGDDVGMSHASNAASIEAMEKGLMTSATIMVPCPWFPEIAAYARAHPEADFGLHLTHTSEWKGYRWGPVAPKTEVPGLVDPQGYLWPSVQEVYAHATPEEALVEARAQIEKALAAGIDVTHLDSHMGTLHYDPAYHAVYRTLALEYDLPIRMPGRAVLAERGLEHLRDQLDADGIVSPDHLIFGGPDEGESVEAYWKRILRTLQPGVTELFIHAALAGEEMRHITNSWKTRDTEYRLFTTDPEIRAMIEEEGIILIGYRELRRLQRGE